MSVIKSAIDSSQDILTFVRVTRILNPVIFNDIVEPRFKVDRSIDIKEQFHWLYTKLKKAKNPYDLVQHYIRDIETLNISISDPDVSQAILNMCKKFDINVTFIKINGPKKIIIGLTARYPPGRRYLAHVYSWELVTKLLKSEGKSNTKLLSTIDGLTSYELVSPSFCPLSTEPEMRLCDKCAKIGSDLVCSGCTYARYCTKKCQRDDWSIHKKQCKKYASLSDSSILPDKV